MTFDSNGDAREIEGFGTCQKVDMKEDYKEPPKDWFACVIDGSGYFAALKTKESFGCVLHELKG